MTKWMCVFISFGGNNTLLEKAARVGGGVHTVASGTP